jgi:hypothetical protein
MQTKSDASALYEDECSPFSGDSCAMLRLVLAPCIRHAIFDQLIQTRQNIFRVGNFHKTICQMIRADTKPVKEQFLGGR